MAAMAVISTLVSIQGQQQQASAQATYQQHEAEATNQQIADNRDIALQSYINQTYASNLAIQEGRDADAAQRSDHQIRRLQATGAIRGAAAEAGITGNSLNALLLDFHRQEALFNTRLDQNQVMREGQQTQELRASGINYKNRVTAIRPFLPSPIAPPDYAGAIGQLAQAGLSYQTATAKRPNVTVSTAGTTRR